MTAPVSESTRTRAFAVSAALGELRAMLRADGCDLGAYPLVVLYEAEAIAGDIASGRRKEFDRPKR